MKKTTLAAVLIAVCLLAAFVAYAVNEYVSNQVTVTVEDLTLTLNVNVTSCITGEALLFFGTLESTSFEIENAEITLYCNGEDTTLSNFTDVAGYYEILFLTTTAGTYNFVTKATT